MTQDQIAQVVHASLHQTGFKQPAWFRLSDGSAIQGVITGLSNRNNAIFVEILDPASNRAKSIAMSRIEEIKTGIP